MSKEGDGCSQVRQVNPKGAHMKGARNGLFFDILTIKKQTFFHDAHIGNGSALWTSWHFTCVSSTHRRNPCGPGTCAHGDFQTPVHWPTPLWLFAPPVLCYASHWLWGPPYSATHTSRSFSRRALLALGLRWLSCIPCPRPIRQNCRHHETQNLSHHRH